MNPLPRDYLGGCGNRAIPDFPPAKFAWNTRLNPPSDNLKNLTVSDAGWSNVAAIIFHEGKYVELQVAFCEA